MTGGRPRRAVLRQGEHGDSADYARDLLGAGGPLSSNLDEARGRGGFHGAVLDAIYGRNKEEFDRSLEYEDRLEQLQRPHVFVRKLAPRGRRGRKP